MKLDKPIIIAYHMNKEIYVEVFIKIKFLKPIRKRRKNE